MVTEYLYYGKGTEYEVVQFLSTLDLNIESQMATHEQMAIVVRYHTPFLINNKYRFILLFTLWRNIVFTQYIRSIHFLSICTRFILPLGKLVCSEFIVMFPLLLDPLGKALLDEASLNDSIICVPPDIPSNSLSLFHYTAMNSFDNLNPNQVTPLDNIIVQDIFFMELSLKIVL